MELQFRQIVMFKNHERREVVHHLEKNKKVYRLLKFSNDLPVSDKIQNS
jgi:hypothetical protein